MSGSERKFGLALPSMAAASRQRAARGLALAGPAHLRDFSAGRRAKRAGPEAWPGTQVTLRKPCVLQGSVLGRCFKEGRSYCASGGSGWGWAPVAQ